MQLSLFRSVLAIAGPAACVAAVALPAAAAAAAPGDLDAGFASGGVFTGSFMTTFPGPEDSQKVAIDSQGRVVVAATLEGQLEGSQQGVPRAIRVFRLTAQGAPDPGFAGGGEVTLPLVGDAYLGGLVIDAQDRPVIAGTAGTIGNVASPKIALVRLTTTGQPDVSFSGDGQLVTGLPATSAAPWVSGLAIDAGGGLLVAGAARSGILGFTKTFYVTRFTAGGDQDGDYGAGGWRQIGLPAEGFRDLVAIAAVPSGGAVVAGHDDNWFVTRLTSTGALDTGFDGDGTATSGLGKDPLDSVVADGLTVDPQGRPIVVGQFTTGEARWAIARWTDTGALDSSFGPGTPTPGVVLAPSNHYRLNDVDVQGDGKLVVVGQANRADLSGNAIAIARYTASGDLDPMFAPGAATAGIALLEAGTTAGGYDLALTASGATVAGFRRATVAPLGLRDLPVVARVLRDGGVPPTPTPSPTPTPTPGGTPTSGATATTGGGAGLRVSGIATATPGAPGRPVVLSAAVAGKADRLLWDLNSDGRTDASCPGSQTTLTFRPSAATTARKAAAFASSATLKAIGGGGVSTFTQSLTPPRGAAVASAAVGRVVAAVATEPKVYACGLVSDLANAVEDSSPWPSSGGFAEAKKFRCEDQTLAAGVLEISGCLKRIRSPDQIPKAELGSIQPLLNLGIPPTRQQVLDDIEVPVRFIPDALDVTDAYVTPFPVVVNGVTWTPQAGASIVLFPQVKRIFSSNAKMSVAGINLKHKPSFSLNTAAKNSQGRIPMGTFPRDGGGVRSFGSFDLTGDVDVVLKARTDTTPAGAELKITLQLPSFLSVVGVDAQKPIAVQVASDGKAVFDAVKIGPIDVSIGPLSVTEFSIVYTDATREWRGTGKLCVEEVACLEALEVPGRTPAGGVVIRDGELQRFYADVTFPGPGIALFPGVQLTRIGAGLGLNPTRLLGGAGLTAAGIFEIDGRLVLAFPSGATPYTLSPDEVGPPSPAGPIPAQFFNRRYPNATMAISADAYLKVPYIDARVRLGGAYLLYSAPAYVAFGGRVSADFFDIISINGGVDGEFNFANARFNLGGDVRVCVVEIICAGAVAPVSSVGVGACVEVDAVIGSINIGGGVRFDPFDVYVWPLDGCNWTKFYDPDVFSARAAQAGKPVEVKIRPGDPGRAIRLDGTTGAPRVRVTTPDGKVLESPDGPGWTATPIVRILRSEKIKATIVGLNDPKPGTYRIEELPGSPSISKLTQADDQPEAKVSATVVGAPGTTRRTLRYDVLRRKDQRVTFIDVGPGGSRQIGTISGGGAGTLSFATPPGTGAHRIEAQFELAGLPAERLRVTRFTPPSPKLPRPSRLTVRRRGTSLKVTWPVVPGSTRYDVIATAASGEQRRIRTTRRSATLKGLPTGSGGRVAVRASAELRAGPNRVATYRATTARAPTRYGPLPKLPPKVRATLVKGR